MNESAVIERPVETTQTIASPEVRHLAALDGVRGLAILMVMLSHTFHANIANSGRLVQWTMEVFYYGKFGVDLFFVLSGFLITGILVDTRDDNHFFKRFYARRTLRIFPLYYAVLIVLALLTVPLHFAWKGMMPWLFVYAQNLFPVRFQNFKISPEIGLFHFWSLAVEEQFYLAWPLIVFWAMRKRGGVLMAAVAGIGLALGLRLFVLVWHGVDLWSVLLVHTNTVARMDSLLIGAVVAVAFRSGRGWRVVERSAPWVCLGLGGLLAGMVMVMGDDDHAGHVLWMEGVRYDLIGLVFAALMAWSLKAGSLVQRGFTLRPMRFLGKYSYGLYVMHVLVLGVLETRLRGPLAALLHSKSAAVAGSGVLCLSLAAVLAWLSYHGFEKHFLHLKRRFRYEMVRPITRV